MTIRPAESPDLETIWSLAAAIPEAPNWTRKMYESYLAESQPDVRLIVAEAAGSLVGFIAGHVVAGTGAPADRSTSVGWGTGAPADRSSSVGLGTGAPADRPLSVGWGICELESIAVDPPHRRSGVGHALLVALTDWAASRGASVIELEVRAGNDSAISFYERHRFRKDGHRPAYYRNPEEDAVLMSLPLKPGNSASSSFPPPFD